MPLPAEGAPSFLLVAELPAPGERVTLAAEESHYLTRVCRTRPGERVSATDGRGALAALRVVEIGRHAVVEVEACERSQPARVAWVLAGAPEGNRGDWMVEKLAELGVAVLVPIDCERGRWERRRDRGERWQRLAVAALRQSRRRFLLEVRAPEAIADAIAKLPGTDGRWLADPAGPAAGGLAAPSSGVAIGLIGPASGLSPGESQRAREAGFQPISLSDGRLRTETAAVAWAGWWAGAVS
jgi:16S rRNA (uracil1498-N3)-methyltransferase